MNTNYNFADNSLTDNAGVRALVTKQQTAFQKVRGSSALALMVATGYIAIRKIATNAPAEIQAAITSHPLRLQKAWHSSSCLSLEKPFSCRLVEKRM